MTLEQPPILLCGVIAPSYNNARTVRGVLDELSDLGFPVIAIDDGSTDGAATEIEHWRASGTPDSPLRQVETHDHNRGKAAALRTGFAHARMLGWTHAVTMDTDGQLAPADVPAIVAAIQAHPLRIICGWRDAEASGMLGRSQVGRAFSNRLVALNCGIHTNDSQCGLRGYPLSLIDSVRVPESRFEFEAACLVRSGWLGIDTADVAVQCMYDVPGGRVSHYRAGRDTVRAAWMHLRLLFLSARPWPVRRHPDLPDPPATIGIGERVSPGTLFTRFLRWLDPRPAWRAVRTNPRGRRQFASALALGAFIANMPVYGGQIALSLLSARILRLPPIPVVAGAHLSTPPLGPLLVIAAIGIGSRVRDGTWPSMADFDPRVHGWIALIQNMLIEWVIGSIVMGIGCAIIVWLVTTLILRSMHQTDQTPSL